MHPDLARDFQRLEQERQAIFAKLEGLDHDHLNRSAEEGAWSIIQVLCHVTLAEKLSVEYLKKMSKSGALGAAGWGSRFRSLLLRLALRSPLRFKAPRGADDLPASQDFATTRSESDDAREVWRVFLEEFPTELLDRAVYRHPRAGTLNIRQAVGFLREHQRTHSKQIDRILAALS